jgi:hypothetical protein
MENLDKQLAEKERQMQVYEDAMASLKQQRLQQEGESLTLMFAWDAFGEQAHEDTSLGKASKLAAMFCIGFAFLTPCLMFIKFVM